MFLSEKNVSAGWCRRVGVVVWRSGSMDFSEHHENLIRASEKLGLRSGVWGFLGVPRYFC